MFEGEHLRFATGLHCEKRSSQQWVLDRPSRMDENEGRMGWMIMLIPGRPLC